MPGPRRLRVLVAALIALAAVLLTACRTNVGSAATVNGERVSENDVTSYLTGKPASAELRQRAEAAGQQIIAARVLVLQYEIEQRLYERTLRRNGGVPSASTLAGGRDSAVATLVGNGQPVTEAQLRTQLRDIGVTASFLPRFLRTVELEYVVIQRLRLTQKSQLAAAVNKAGAEVTVSPRYGSWDAGELALRTSGTGGGVPAYLRLQSASASPAAP